MRRQMKIAAVVSATALLAIGASFTSMAAAKTGTWKLEDEGWVCYDKDGDYYEDEFCLDGGKEYYVGDDGVLVTNSWVDYDGETYYVGSTGAKTINAWRNVVPEADEDDEDAEAKWFYFGSKGKVTTGKKVIDNNTYYFDKDGIMLTGWVDYSKDANGDYVAEAIDTEIAAMPSTVVYTDENGARVANAWINTYAPGTDEDKIEEGDAETAWYWIKAKGAAQVGKNHDINGETYYFGVDGKMLSGWVVGENLDTDETTDDVYYMSTASDAIANNDVFFCGGEDQGWSKKNTWIKTWAPEKYEAEDDDNDQYWYWLGKDGKVFKADTASSANAMKFVNGEDGIIIPDGDDLGVEMKEINKKTYAFKSNGQMWKGLVMVDDEYMYYFGGANDGAMKTGSVMVADGDDDEYKFFFGEKTNDDQGYVKGAAVTGNAGGKLYINGQLQTTDNKYEPVPVDGIGTFMIDADGDIRTSKKIYKDDNDVEYNLEGVTFNPTKGVTYGSY